MKSISWLVLLVIMGSTFSCGGEKGPVSAPITRADTDTDAVKVPEPTFNPYIGVDVSPMDMSYFPVDYPKLKMAHSIQVPPHARVIYSRPHLAGRQLFNEVLKYGEPWRLGANEATEIQLYKEAAIQDKKMAPGRYVMYCIPQPDKWIIVLNSNLDSWGLTQEADKDIARFEVPSVTTTNHVEFFTMVFEKKASDAELVMAWGNTEVRLRIRF